MGDPSFSVRVLTAEDAEAYRTLRLAALRDHPEAFGAAYEDVAQMPRESLAASIAQPSEAGFVLAAIAEDSLVGVLELKRDLRLKHRHRAVLFGMYVAPGWRKLGVARTLIEEAIRRARQFEGLEMVILAVTIGNHAARALYISAGFEPRYVDERYLKFGDRYYDMEWMRLMLV